VFLREKIPLELHTISASDIQGFVERKQNVFYLYLIDKQMILPEPQDDDITTPTTPHVDSSASPSATSASGGGVATATTKYIYK
jgi:hypothetical protein